MEDQINVAKFGGTSVANIESIEKCIEIIRNTPAIKVIVVSAQSGVTNLLVKLVTHCNSEKSIQQTINEIENIIHPILEHIQDLETSVRIKEVLKDLEFLTKLSLRLKTPQLSDEILSFGELISATIMTQLLIQSGINARYLRATEVIKTDSNYGQAKPLTKVIRLNVQDKLVPLINDSIIVTEGFIGQDSQGLTTTLGRGGSDYSAALIAEAIDARDLLIWTDVPGIYQADPRTIPNAAPIEKMSYNEAAELATFGAKVLHPSTLWPAIRNNINVFIGSTFNPNNPGTWITKDSEQQLPIVRAVAERKNQILVTIKSYDMVHTQGFLAKVFQVLANHKVSIDLVTTSEVSIALTLDHVGSQSIGNTILTPSLLEELNEIGDVEIKVDKNLSLVAVVGNNIHQTKNISSRLFSGLSDHNIRLLSHGASGHNMCLLVDQSESSQVMQKIYNQFFEREVTV
ncbi:MULTISPECIES: lysine-sensitive aspartokinase 3 [unclassified Francisella]|uniref:lysine-sensitive aspartokinase 3 n=1 Tax=unclassified Francisella TaxID=2610885 RepID=UPI002E363AA1|nr:MULTISPECIES: lysine-sensitive aspartokinase 3 [unclassified Francisella]MED7819891.1 lysine-sensitive aspartokinase 3 [Francisella sp. 19S2-4]MED7830691.1 lysine-sensitive aspartokinase 3 [Francisella sp. 19S2-10]